MLIAFHKPYGVLSQFTTDGSSYRTLKEFSFPPGVYPVGRLDADSEGLLLLSDEPFFNQKLLDPKCAHPRVYWAQVERVPSSCDLQKLSEGIVLQGRMTLPAKARILHPQPEIPERVPPIRFRKNVPTCWIEMRLIEGKNRQVRRMTAAIGFPTLRLLRVRIGDYRLSALAQGSWKEMDERDRDRVLMRRDKNERRTERKSR